MHDERPGAADAPEGTTSRQRVPDGAVAAVVVGLASVAAWIRLLPAGRGVVWAEDGRLFLHDRLARGTFATLLSPLDGYLHVVPRLAVSLVVWLLPLADYAHGLALITCLIAGLVAGLVFTCSRDVVAWRPAQVAIALTTVLLPAAPIEVLGNAANIHWLFLWLAPWLLLYRPRSRAGTAGLAVAALLAGATEIQMLLFLPLVLVNRRERRCWWVAGATAVGIAGQLIATLVDPRHRSGPVPTPASTVAGYLVNGVGSAVTGSSSTIGGWVAGHGLLLIGAALVPALGAVAWTVRSGSSRQRLVVLVLAGGSAVVWIAAGIANRWRGLAYGGFTSAQWHAFSLIRYGVVPAMFLTATIGVAASVLREHGRRTAAALTLVILAGVWAASWTVPRTQRTGGPSWSAQVHIEQRACRARPPRPTTPLLTAPVGWSVEVSCAELRSTS